MNKFAFPTTRISVANFRTLQIPSMGFFADAETSIDTKESVFFITADGEILVDADGKYFEVHA